MSDHGLDFLRERRKLTRYMGRDDLTITERHAIRGALLSLDWVLGRDVPPSQVIESESVDL